MQGDEGNGNVLSLGGLKVWTWWCLQSWLGHPSLHPLLPRLGCCTWRFQAYIKVLSGCQGVNDPPQMPVPQGEERGDPPLVLGNAPWALLAQERLCGLG